jgi:hypothetical protein
MPGIIRAIMRATPLVVASVVMAAAGVSPDDAASNLGSWWKLTGYPSPDWLKTPKADHTAFIVCILFVFVWILLLWFTRKTDSLSTPEARPTQIINAGRDNYGHNINNTTISTNDFILTDEIKLATLIKLNPKEKVGIAWKNGRSKTFADDISNYLKQNGFDVLDVLMFDDHIPYVAGQPYPMTERIQVFPTGFWPGFESGGARQVVVVDVSL